MFDPKPTESPTDEPRLRRAHAVTWGAASLALLVVALMAVPLTGASPAAPASGVHAAGGNVSTGQWAWGAFENTSVSVEYVGAYAENLNLTGNLSTARAVAAEAEALHAEYGAFAVVNASAPTPTTRAVEATAVEIANYSGEVEVAGQLPIAGTYAAGAVIPLTNSTAAYAASVLGVRAYSLFGNYTLVHGNLSLVNEHVSEWIGSETSIVAYKWPSIVLDSNGSTTVNYTTAGAFNASWIGASLTASFSPALPISVAPLTVGETWNATTQAQVSGWIGYATAAAYTNGVTNVTASSSGGASLNASVPLTVDFDVVSSESVVLPNGTTTTGYTVQATVNGSGSSNYTLWDGLALIPGSAPKQADSPRVAAPLDRAAPVSPVETTPTDAVVTSGGLPVSDSSTVAPGTTLTTAPVASQKALGEIASTGTPAAPVKATPPAVSTLPGTTAPVTTPPPTSGTQPPAGVTPPTTSAPKSSSGTDPYLLTTLVAGIALIFLAVELVRQRKKV
jgi:hypothetical protein